MISVIVPVYKVEAYLERCVDSICRQSYRDLEIILVDDGSPDRCPQICDELARRDNRIKVIHKKNGGASSARNAGLDVATGEFIAFVDSDDYVLPDMMGTLLSLIKNNDIAICGYRKVDESLPIKNNRPLCNNENLSTEELWHEIFCKLNNAVWNKLYRRAQIDVLRFPLNMLHGEDLIFNLLYLCKCRCGAINRTPLYNYLTRSNSVTNSKFRDGRFLEITSKDAACEIVKNHKPEYIQMAQLFAFRARMNVMRAIHHEHLENQYQSAVSEMRSYVNGHYSIVKRLMQAKERIEYVIFKYAYSLYRKMV